MKKLIITFYLLAFIGMWFNTGCSTPPKLTKEEASQQLADLKRKYDIESTQWYDI